MTKITANNLQPLTNYIIQVRAVSATEYSDWSRGYQFTTISDTIAPLTPVNVTWTTIGDSFMGEWDEVTQNTNGREIVIDRYEVELTAGTTKVIAVTPKTGRNSYVLSKSANTALFGTLKTSITMRVRSWSKAGNASAWSAPITASNQAPGPVTNAVATPVKDGVRIVWDAPADTNILRYEIYVGTTSNFIPSQENRIFASDATEFTYLTTTYALHYFKIRVVNILNLSSTDVTVSGMPINPFIVDSTPPAVPTNLAASMGTNADGRTSYVLVSWNAPVDTDLAGYVVRYRKTGTTDNYAFTNVAKGTTSIRVDLPVAYTSYDFAVRSVDADFNFSNYSADVTATAPTNVAPGNVSGLTGTAGKDSITYSWTPLADTDIANYEVTVSTSSTFATGNTTFKTGTASSLTVGGLTAGTTYYARVRAIDTGGLTSAGWSATDTRTTGAFPTTPLSDGYAPGSSPTPVVTSGLGYLYVTWSPVTLNSNGGTQADTVTYEVHMSTTSGFTPSSATKVTEVSGTFALIDTLPGSTTGLTYGTTYYVRLVAKDRDGTAVVGTQASGVPSKAVIGDLSVTAGDLGAPTTTQMNSADAAVKSYVQSRGMNLVANGSALLGNNTNFSSMTLVTSDSPSGGGSFEHPLSGFDYNDEFLPIDTARNYTFSYQARQAGTSTTAVLYGFIWSFDIDGFGIQPEHTMYQAGTTTTLAAPLNPGDTTITLTSVTNWNNAAGAAGHLRNIIFWDYVDGKGKPWPTQTYSRNVINDAYADGGINTSTKVITLKTPYSGATRAAGTPVSNGASGGSYKYIAGSASLVPVPWTTFSGKIGGVDTSGQNIDSKFHPGTAFVRVGWLLNRTPAGPNDSTSNMRIANIWFSEISSANLPEIATAQATADGKNKIIVSTSDASGTSLNGVSFVTGDIWFKKNGSNEIIAQWEYAGSAWLSKTIHSDVIANLNVGKLVSGSISTADVILTSTGTIRSNDYNQINKTGWRLYNGGLEIWQGKVSANILEANTTITSNLGVTGVLTISSTGALQSTNYNTTNKTGYKLDASGLDVQSGSIRASALIGDTLGSSTGVINIGVGASIVMNGGYLKSNTYTGTSQATNPSGAGFYLGNDGIRIDQGIVSASALVAGTISGTNTITLSGAGAKIVGPGFELSGSGLTVTSGTVAATALTITNAFANSVIGSASASTVNAAVTQISGDKITTGIIQSDPSYNVTIDGVSQPLWVIPRTGMATFAGLNVRGNVIVGMTSNDTQSMISSANYVQGGTVGWRLQANGDAYFNKNLTAQNAVINGIISTAAVGTYPRAEISDQVRKFTASGITYSTNEAGLYLFSSSGSGLQRVYSTGSNIKMESISSSLYNSYVLASSGSTATSPSVTIYAGAGTITLNAGTTDLNGGNLNGIGTLNANATVITLGSDTKFNGVNNEFPNIPTITTGTANANLAALGAGNRLRLITSLSKYKLEQKEITLEEASGLLNVTPKTWFDSSEVQANGGKTTGLQRGVGFIAEDVEKHAPTYALYSEGKLSSVAYDRFPAGILVLVKDLYERNKTLEAKVAQLEEEAKGTPVDLIKEMSKALKRIEALEKSQNAAKKS